MCEIFYRKIFFDSTAIATSLYSPAYPKYLAETILPPPTPCECRECAEDAPRSVQMHTGASSAYVPTLSRPCLCFWTLPYSVVFSIIAWFFHLSSGRKFRPVHIAIPRTGVEPTWGLNRTYAVFSRLSSEVISLVQPLTHIQHEEASRGLSGPLLSSVSFSHMKEQKSRKNNGGQPRLPPLSLHRFCFREPLRKTLTDSFFGYLSYFSGT